MRGDVPGTVEEVASAAPGTSATAGPVSAPAVPIGEVRSDAAAFRSSGVPELDASSAWVIVISLTASTSYGILGIVLVLLIGLLLILPVKSTRVAAN